MSCLDPELLSAYADREAGAEEASRVEAHLDSCPRCRTSLRVIRGLKTGLRDQTAPPMPAGLQASLERLIPGSPEPVAGTGGLGSWLDAFRGCRGWRPALGLAAACSLLVFVLRLGLGRPDAVPVDLLLAAHNRYAVTLPLAETERILSELPLQLASGDTEASSRDF